MSKVTITIDSLRNLKEAQNLIRRAERELKPLGWWHSRPKPYVRAALLRVDGEPVSVMCYYAVDKTRALQSDSEIVRSLAGTILIMGAYTARKWRRKGAYKILWNQLIKTYKDDDDFIVVRSGSVKENHASIQMQYQQGRDFFEQGKTHVRSRFYLRPTRWQKMERKLNWLRYKTVGLPFREKTQYGEDV